MTALFLDEAVPQPGRHPDGRVDQAVHSSRTRAAAPSRIGEAERCSRTVTAACAGRAQPGSGTTATGQAAWWSTPWATRPSWSPK